MRGLRKIVALTVLGCTLGFSGSIQAAEFKVYGTFKGLDLGFPGEAPQRDYYVNMGTNHGLREGSLLEVVRRIPTHDLNAQKLFKDINVPIATLKVIHVDGSVAIARIEKMLPAEKLPSMTFRTVLVGDAVRLPQ